MDQINFIECTIKEYCPIIAFTLPAPAPSGIWSEDETRAENDFMSKGRNGDFRSRRLLW